MEITLTDTLRSRVADLYRRMEEAYDNVAASLNFSCQGCPDNCCDSYFLHYTYVEWAYLQDGLLRLDPARLEILESRARSWLLDSERMAARGQRPQVMCPLNEKGRCVLYSHRLMICRLHGVPSRMELPDGRRQTSAGCYRCQEQAGDQHATVAVDRTPFYRELAELERELIGGCGRPVPRLRLTIAQMIVRGGPTI